MNWWIDRGFFLTLSHGIDKCFVGLCRGDGLGVFRNYSGPASERKQNY